MKNSTTHTNSFHLILQTNSPGELASWVSPIAKYSKATHKSIFITLCLAPCQYASGYEYEAAKSISEIDEVFKPNETIKICFGLKKVSKKANTGAILCLGGDPLYTQLLKFKTKYSANIYTEHKKKPGLFFDNIFFKHEIGDLMQARVQNYLSTPQNIYKKYNLEKKDYILFFPGSRPKHFEVFSEMCLKIATLLIQNNPSIDVIMPLATTIPKDQIKLFKNKITSPRINILTGDSLDFMSISKLMISLPGTNTAEALYMHLPMITLVPFNRLDLLDVDGLLGLLLKFPYLGGLLKKLIFPRLIKKIKFISLPNIITKSLIVPEIRDFIKTEKTTKLIINLLANQKRLNEIKTNLKNVKHTIDVEKKILDKIIYYVSI